MTAKGMDSGIREEGWNYNPSQENRHIVKEWASIESPSATWAIQIWNSLARSHHKHTQFSDEQSKVTGNKITHWWLVSKNQRLCMYVRDSQSLDACNDGVEGSLNIGSRARGDNGLALFMEQLGCAAAANKWN